MYRIAFIVSLVVISAHTALGLSGSGTEAEPWRIKSLADFNEFAADANYWDGWTRLENDVNLAGLTYTTALIAPDTDNSNGRFDGIAFTGVFDGNDHKIINLSIEDEGAGNDYLGLFGSIDNGEVRNLGMEGGSIIGDRYIGGLVGGNYYSSIWKCNSNSDIRGLKDVGGLLGINRGFVSNCYSTGSVSGDYEVGGLVGRNERRVTGSYSVGDVNGGRSVGGLVGYNWGGSVSICYSTCDVNGVGFVGGIIGRIDAGGVWNCYSVGDISGDYYVGGFVGENYYGVVSNCFWDIETQTHGVTESIGHDQGTVTNVFGLPTAQMQTKSTFASAGWDFINELADGTSETWQMPYGSGYPVLSFFHIDIPYPLAGFGTSSQPYLIRDANELGMVNWYPVNCHFKMIRDIDLSGIDWSVAVINVFNGCFDGNDYIISNIKMSGDGGLGLFGNIEEDGQVRNLGLECGSIIGGDSVGSLVVSNSGNVSNCYSTAHVSGDCYIGGLVVGNDGSVSNCYYIGSVSGNCCIGGLVGVNSMGIVSNCYFSGTVICDGFMVGGLVGGNYDCGIILNSYTNGTINGGECVGGLVGYNYENVSNCYSTVDISGDYHVGGLVGENRSGSVSNCFWDTDTQTHGVIVSFGDNDGIVTNVFGLPTAQMQSKSTFTDIGWDFIDEYANGTSETWQIPTGVGYPVLSVFHIDIPYPLAGSGTESQPYLVNDANELGMLSWYPLDCYFKLTGDIDLSGINWSVPVVPSFSGYFDGNNCIINNMQISGGGCLGLFGFLRKQGQIRNLGLGGGSVKGTGSLVGGLVGYKQDGFVSQCNSIVDISGFKYVGGLVGENWDGIVSHCYSTGSITGTGRAIGGLVGGNSFGNVSNCYSKGDVSGGEEVGGLMGFNDGSISKCYFTGDVNGFEDTGGLVGTTFGNVSNCYSTGTVSGGEDVGGLAGFGHGIISNCYSTSCVSGDNSVGGLMGEAFYGDMLNCYSTGPVSGDRYVGGIVGDNRGLVSNCYSNASVSGNECVGGLVGQNGSINPVISDPGNIYNSYSTGRVQGVSFFGGLVGYHEWGDIDGSFWDIDTSEQLESDGGTGKTTSDMKKKSTFTDAGWDFVDVWDLTCEGMSYPRFIWQITLADFLCPHGVDFKDYSFFAGYWGYTNCGDANDCEGADFDLSGAVGIWDFDIFCGYWLNGADG